MPVSVEFLRRTDSAVLGHAEIEFDALPAEGAKVEIGQDKFEVQSVITIRNSTDNRATIFLW